MHHSMDLEKLRGQVLANISSLLAACKGAVPVKQLSDDYWAVMKSPIPFQVLGFARLDEFLQSAPGQVACSYFNGKLHVEATAHEAAFRILERQRRSPTKIYNLTNRPRNQTGRQPLLANPPGPRALRPTPLMSVTVPPGPPPPSRSVIFRTPPPARYRHSVPYSPLQIRLPPAVPPIKVKLTKRELLARMLAERSLGPAEYQSVRMSCKGPAKFLGKVTVAGKQTFSSYPKEFTSVEDAYEEAASEAVQHFQREKAADDLPETKDMAVIVERIISIVGNNSQGFWSPHIQEMYLKNYKERLPANWIAAVSEATKSVVFEPIGDNIAVYPGTDKVDAAMEPVPGTFPESESSVVHVVVVLGADQVAVRLIDSAHYQEWEDMMNDVELYYTEQEASLVAVDEMQSNKLYVARIDEKSWLRVQLEQLLDNNMVRVLLVDYADAETIPLSDVFPLLAKFCKVPCQGFQCNLFGLSPFTKSDVAVQAAVKSLVDEQFIARIVSRQPQISLVLYKNCSGKEVNMNQAILNEIADKSIPIPLQMGLFSQVVVSYVSSTGDLFVLRDTPQQKVIESLIALLRFGAEPCPQVAISSINPASGKIYLADSGTRGWCRVTVHSSSMDGKVVVRLIDYGDTEILAIGSLRELLWPVLSRLAGEASRVRLARVPPSPLLEFTDRAAQRLREIAPRDSRFLMRIVDMAAPPAPPVVELYERLPSAKIVIINASLEMDETLFRASRADAGDADHLSSPTVRSPVLDFKMFQAAATSISFISEAKARVTPLPEPVAVMELPVSGSQLDVHVCHVSNPHLFYIQPVDTFSQLKSMMESLQDFCGKLDKDLNDLDETSIAVNGYYAALDSKTNLFHRVQIKHKVNHDYLVYLIDYGGNEVVSVANIKPLDAQFLTLPPQAIKARLAGIKPIHGDWSMNDVLFFKKLIDNKELHSQVIDVAGDQVVQLELLDGGKDSRGIAVSKYLVEQQHAQAA